MRTVETIVTHGNCVDGFMSELILRKCHPRASVIRMTYDKLAELEPTPNMLFCDMAPPIERAEAFFAAGAYVLDHHKSAAPVFEVKGAWGEYGSEPGVSGAVLAFKYAVTMGVDVWGAESIVKLVGIYDTWVSDHPFFETACEAHAVLDVLKGRADSLELDEVVKDWAAYSKLGALLFERDRERAREVAERAVVKTVEIQGRMVRVGCIVDGVSTGILNMASTQIDADVVLSAGFERGVKPSDRWAMVEEIEGHLSCSLRSRGDFDCSELAKSFGGGGHRGAAGFRIDRRKLPRPVQVALHALTNPHGAW